LGIGSSPELEKKERRKEGKARRKKRKGLWRIYMLWGGWEVNDSRML